MKRLTYRDEEGGTHWRQELLGDDTGWAGELIRSTVADMEDAIEKLRLDRSAWEPCEWCGEWIGGDCRPKEKDVGYRLYAGFCKQVAADDFWEDETENLNFCPICGRPLTDSAWEMLERRLTGRE